MNYTFVNRVGGLLSNYTCPVVMRGQVSNVMKAWLPLLPMERAPDKVLGISSLGASVSVAFHRNGAGLLRYRCKYTRAD